MRVRQSIISSVAELMERREQLHDQISKTAEHPSQSIGLFRADRNSLAEQAQASLLEIYQVSAQANVEISRLTADIQCALPTAPGYSVRFVGSYDGIAEVVRRLVEEDSRWLITRAQMHVDSSQMNQLVMHVETCISFVSNL